MSLQPGVRLGPYEILALIGVGGMGEVYKARDTRLDRVVAIKVLLADIASDPQFRERFEREARAVAALNHPHICTLYDIGSQDGVDFLVMEYLDGETLAGRLARGEGLRPSRGSSASGGGAPRALNEGALPLDQALRYVVEIADALDKAHRRGITHRDLKPGNVMLTKAGTKLLDFGLAKLRPAATGPVAGMSAAPTISSPLTGQGTILGTLQYMAPEQLEGKEADARTDIFAFGAVVYEMVTGKKAFEGKSHASLISAIMSSDPPPISTLQPLSPLALDRLVGTCLAKDPDNRWQSIGDLTRELKWIADSGTQPGIPAATASPPKTRERLAWALAAMASLLVLAMAAAGFFYLREPPKPEEIQFLVPTADSQSPSTIAISPDGRWIAYAAATSANTTGIFVRQIGSTSPQELDGADGGGGLFWSPDSRSIGFFANGTLKKISVSGGPPQVIGRAPGNTSGGTWNTEGVIVFSRENNLYRISAGGGEPVPLTLGGPQQETLGVYPYFLPDGRHFLYLSGQGASRGLYIGSLDSKETKRILDIASKTIYVEPGYLLYQRDGTLFAHAFDAKQLTVRGEAVRIADHIAYNAATATAAFSASSGVLLYRGGGMAQNFQFAWFDRTGKQIALAAEPAPYRYSFDLSPEENRFVVSLRGDLWLVDSARGISTRLTSDSPDESDVVWSPDGLRVAYSSDRKGHQDIYERKVTGIGEETLLVESTEGKWAEDWSKDGRYIAYVAPDGLYALPLFGDRKPFRILLKGTGTLNEPHFSFDGKWLAYDSNESGTWQIYVISFPGGEQKRQISTTGGGQSRWRRDGKELYYLALDGKMMAVDTSTGAKIDSGTPRVLFNTTLIVDPVHDQYAVTSDGQRFLLRMPVTATAPITAVVNWTAGLKK